MLMKRFVHIPIPQNWSSPLAQVQVLARATMLYHETHDILLVKEILGHKTLNTTLLYVQIEKALFRNEADNFTVKATKEPAEIEALLEVGFEFVCQKDDLMFFRKRK